MTISVIASIKGAPGVTSLACRIADAWPTDRTLTVVELDSAGGDLAARLGVNWRRGLSSFAAATRRDRVALALEEHVHRFSPGLAVMVSPPAPASLDGSASGHIGPEAIRSLIASEGCDDFLCDVGRLAGAGSAAGTALEAADSITVVVHPDPGQVLQLKTWTRELRRRRAGALGVVVVGSGPYGADEIASFADVEVIARIDDLTRAAGGAGRRRLMRRTSPDQRWLNSVITHMLDAGRALPDEVSPCESPTGHGEEARAPEETQAWPSDVPPSGGRTSNGDATGRVASHAGGSIRLGTWTPEVCA